MSTRQDSFVSICSINSNYRKFYLGNVCQLSYRKGKGTRDGIFILRTIGERMTQKNRKVYMVFIDYQKAFDRVNHERLIEILKQEGIPAHEIRIIEHLYWNQKAAVIMENGETEEVDILRGVRQGCIYRQCSLICIRKG